MTKYGLLTVIGVCLAVLIVAAIFWPRPSVAPTGNVSVPSPPSATIIPLSPTSTVSSSTKQVSTSEIPNIDSHYDFTLTIPSAWQVEAVPGSQALNIYDPAAAGSSTLDKSQIFIRYFTGNDFLTLTTVDILERTSLTVGGRPAVRYEILKKSSAPRFPQQPSWRNEQHSVTDIRVSDANPSTFYVVAQRPGLEDAVYETVLQSLASPLQPQSLLPPIDEFRERITKKSFGTYVTPQNSPVQPERFTGYHTGVDVEYDDVAGEVPVRAIASGEVVSARVAQGYGGVMVVRHEIGGTERLVVYGHLKPDNVRRIRSTVNAGDQIGILGAGGTAETDGERKHLHFAILKGTQTDLRGYVQTEGELTAWIDPLRLY